MALVVFDPALEKAKTCSNCGGVKAISDFAKHKTGKYGVSAMCKACKNTYRSQYYEANKEKSLEYSRKWSASNLAKKRAATAKRKAFLLKATPKWADEILIRRVYSEADFLTKVTGIRYEVDHVIPLQGKRVCGLHVQNNLQVIKLVDNRKKAYKHES